MKTRYTPLIKLKKDTMDKRERDLQHANAALQNAQAALSRAYEELQSATTPASGVVSQFLASRMLISTQRGIIAREQEWVSFAATQCDKAKEALKQSMVEYEKFKYLETEQLKNMLQKEKQREQREMDEIASQSFNAKKEES